jgi:hypothetical protein
VPGPTIEVTEGDRVRLVVENRLPEGFSMHWHGLEIPNDMDGMPGISQDVIPPGGQFTYEFTLKQNGTFFYHSHMAMQEMMGMIGLFIIHPRAAYTPYVDRDFVVLQEWALLPNNTIPNSLAMEFNWLTMNGKAGPATTPLLVKLGERVRIRLVNLGMDHHPMHIHGHQFYVTGTEGGRIRTTAVEPANTVLVGVAQARDVEFVADNPGDWHFHCHLPHHMMNQMASMVGPLMMTHANAPRPGSMEAGMGIHEGHALSDAARPAFGRTINVGAEADRAVSNMPQAAQTQTSLSQAPGAAPNAGMFPAIRRTCSSDGRRRSKPETYDFVGWSGGTMGMMTIVRVLTPELFDKIGAKAEQAKRQARTRSPALVALLPMHNPAFAQTGPQASLMTLGELEQLALQNNPTATAAAAGIDAARGRTRQAGAWPNPVIGYSGEELKTGDLDRRGEHGFFVEQTVPLGGKLRLSRDIFQKTVDRAEAIRDLQRLRILSPSGRRFYGVLLAERRVMVQERLAALVSEAVGVTAQLFNVGAADRPDYLEIEIEARRAQLQLNRSKNEVVALRGHLAALTGVREVAARPLAGSIDAALPELAREQIVRAVFDQSPELRAAQAELARTRAVTTRERRETFPDLFLRGGAAYNREHGEDTGRPIGWEGTAEAASVFLSSTETRVRSQRLAPRRRRRKPKSHGSSSRSNRAPHRSLRIT